MKDAIALMREAFGDLSEGNVHVPIRMNMGIPEYEARALFMPVYSPLRGQIAQKVVTIHPENGRHGLPFIHALVLLIDATRGTPLAVMDGEFITALRTGAGSGLATDLLARPDASTVAIFGAGVQARTQLEAVCAVRLVDTVLIFGRSPENVARFASEITNTLEVHVSTPQDPANLADADIVCTATTSLTPVFDNAHIKDGCHINGVGSYRPDMNEIPIDTVRRAALFVDQRAAALEEAGDLVIPLTDGYITAEHVRAELGEIVNGISKGRISRDEVTFFKSVGNAVQDLVVASHVYAFAKEYDLGATVTL